ncbi:MAG: endonuclease [Oscillospiraceae bacterium]|nr:endonuclease [Oscillospiraceae bacterium]
MKRFIKILLILVLVVIVAFVGLAGFLTVTEFRPAPVETLEIRGTSDSAAPLPWDEIRVLSWNIGYAGLGKDEDFFMDGGTRARPGDRDTVDSYLRGIGLSIENTASDLVLLQEVDSDSSRTYGIDETVPLARSFSAYAMNYSCPFVPVPFPPMGKVHSGLFTTTDYEIATADRIALPCPFSWPLSTANLKRCLLVTHIPIEGTEQELVLVNLHLEAYDDGEGKAAQTRQLMDYLQTEYEKGNYVVAGGDFNQIFPGGNNVWPNTHPELWLPTDLETSSLPEGFGFAYDLNVPTCRLLNQPYNPSDTVNTQYYTIDGFIVSPNVSVTSVETLDLGFEFSDHNPVLMQFTLK